MTPNPGSTEAKAQGCLCPVMDNSGGRGYMGNPDVFVRVEDCPLHGFWSQVHVIADSVKKWPDWKKEGWAVLDKREGGEAQ